MTALRFASVTALRFAITSGLLPEQVLRSPARAVRSDDGAIVVEPEIAMRKRELDALFAAMREEGALTRIGASPKAERVGSWAELIPLERRALADDADAMVVFLLEDAQALVDLGGELIRLGCDRLEYRTGEIASAAGRGARAAAFVRAASPPYFTLVRALDHVGGLRAFTASPPGQDRVYVEVGYEHPLARLLVPDEGSTLFFSPDRPLLIARGGAFRDMYAIVTLRVPGSADIGPPLGATELPPLAVPVRLARAAELDAPSLWILRSDAVPRVEGLLRTLPESLVHTLLFAAFEHEGSPVVVLRARNADRPPTLELTAEAYRAHASISNLFTPQGALLEPPIRRDRLRELLAPDPDVITWTRATDAGGFVVERLADAAFRPLTDWIAYVVDTAGPPLDAWVKSARFDFDAFVGVDADLSRERARDDDDAPPDSDATRGRRRPRQPATTRSGRAKTSAARARAGIEVTSRLTLSGAPLARADAAVRLAEKERELQEMEGAPDAHERSIAWAELGELYAATGQLRDAALSWSRAFFELPLPEARAVSEVWREAETRAQPERAGRAPTPETIRADASVVIHDGFAPIAPRDLATRAHELTVFFDRHDGALDTRTAWLVRVALSRAVGGDRLGLARARDRMLARLHGGLSLERDVPALLRFAGGGRDAAQVDVLCDRLERFYVHVQTAKRKRSATEAPVALTTAYVGFVVASGLARLGRSDRARALVADVTKALDLADRVHAFLCAAFTARVEQALEGLPPETALPAAIAARLPELAKLERYKVDRVRQYSALLEPHERLDPIAAFQRGEEDPRGPEFAPLRGLADPAELEQRTAAIMEQAKGIEPRERARLYDGVMDFFPALAAERAREHLAEIATAVDDVPPARRAELLEEALMLAGHFGDDALARAVFGRLERLLASLPHEEIADIAPVLGGTMRTLRRVGLRDDARSLLSALKGAATGARPVDVVARLHAAAALAYLGDLDAAQPVFEEALGLLQGELKVPDRLVMTRACAKALSSAPFDVAVRGLDALWARLDAVTDSFNTNSHVCLSVLEYAESLVQGYVSEDLVIGPEGRRWLDEDEYLLRRRIHRDTAAG